MADVPERKNDLVEGKYTVEAKKGAAVAVKVPIQVIRIDLFVSSPSDLSEERQIVKRVIEKLNRS